MLAENEYGVIFPGENMSCKLYGRPELFGKSSFLTEGLLYSTDALGTPHMVRMPRQPFVFAETPRAQSAIPAFRHNKLRDFFRSMHAPEHSNGARYDAYYNPSAIQKAFIARQPA